jgi:L-amino acid N-acyltransferase YncA
MSFATRLARIGDAEDIATIYNEGIADRIATFETEPRMAGQVAGWFDGRHPIVVVEDERQSVVAFASTSSYRDRACYAGVAEFSVYVARRCRGSGAGRVAMTALLKAAAEAGLWKLISRIFPERAVPSWRASASVKSASINGTASSVTNGAIASSSSAFSATPDARTSKLSLGVLRRVRLMR